MLGRKVGNKYFFLLVFSITLPFIISGCSFNAPKPTFTVEKLEPIKFKETAKPSEEVRQRLDFIINNSTDVPKPKVVKDGNITWYCFTSDQMVSLIERNMFFKEVKEIASDQQEQIDLYVIEIDKLKELASKERDMSIAYQDLYGKTFKFAESQYSKLQVLKTLTIGGIALAVVGLAL